MYYRHIPETFLIKQLRYVNQTNFVEQNASREANFHLNVHYHILKNPPLVHILRLLSQNTLFLITILILSSQLHLGLPSGFLINISECTSHPVHLNLLHLILEKVLTCLITQFSPAESISSLFGPNTLPTTLFLNVPKLCSFINIREHIFHSYTTTDKITAL